MKYAIIAATVVAFAGPALAQDDTGMPLLRVFIDSPYFYDIIAQQTDGSDPAAHQMVLTVEGKEVGSSDITYDCSTGKFKETVTQEWSGNAANFIPAALMAYRDLYC